MPPFPTDLLTLQHALIPVIPLVAPYVGSASAAILKQNKLPTIANDSIAWGVLVLTAILVAFSTGKLSGDLGAYPSVIATVAFTLIAGPMSSLKPWLISLDWIQSNWFDLSHLFESFSQPVAVDPHITLKRIPVVSTGTTSPTSVVLPAMPRVSNAMQDTQRYPSIGKANPLTQPPAKIYSPLGNLGSMEPVIQAQPKITPPPDISG